MDDVRKLSFDIQEVLQEQMVELRRHALQLTMGHYIDMPDSEAGKIRRSKPLLPEQDERPATISIHAHKPTPVSSASIPEEQRILVNKMFDAYDGLLAVRRNAEPVEIAHAAGEIRKLRLQVAREVDRGSLPRLLPLFLDAAHGLGMSEFKTNWAIEFEKVSRRHLRENPKPPPRGGA